MLKRFIPLMFVILLCFTTFIFPVSAAETNNIKYPIWSEFEELKSNLPVSYDDKTFDSHFLIYSDNENYSFSDGGWDFNGYSKLYCYAFDSNVVTYFDYYASYSSNKFPAIYPDVDYKEQGVYKYYYDFVVGKWVFIDFINSYDTNSAGTLRVADKEHIFYSDFDLDVKYYTPGSTSNDYVFTAGSIYGLEAPSWQSLTWKEISVFPVDLMSEIIVILPVCIVFLVLSLAIHKGVSFLLFVLRNA